MGRIWQLSDRNGLFHPCYAKCVALIYSIIIIIISYSCLQFVKGKAAFSGSYFKKDVSRGEQQIGDQD